MRMLIFLVRQFRISMAIQKNDINKFVFELMYQWTALLQNPMLPQPWSCRPRQWRGHWDQEAASQFSNCPTIYCWHTMLVRGKSREANLVAHDTRARPSHPELWFLKIAYFLKKTCFKIMTVTLNEALWSNAKRLLSVKRDGSFQGEQNDDVVALHWFCTFCGR